MGRPWARILGVLPLTLALVPPQSPSTLLGQGLGRTATPWGPFPTILHPHGAHGWGSGRPCTALRATPTPPTGPPSQSEVPHVFINPSEGPLGEEATEWPPKVAEMTDNIAYMYLSQRLDLGEEAMLTITRRTPSVLALSVAGNIIPTLQFLVDALELDPDMTRTMLRKQPAVLGLSVRDK